MLRRITKLKNVGRFAELKSQSGNQGDFAKMNVIYARNASGKSTLCDILRSLSSGESGYVTGRKRFGSETPIEIEILLHGTPTPKSVLMNGTWSIDPAETSTPRIMIYDDRFVADNVLVGQHVSVEQRRNLYGFVIGAQGVALKQTVDTAEKDLNNATNALNAARATLAALVPIGWNIDSFRPLLKDEDIDHHIKETIEQLDVAKRVKQNADAMRQRRLLQLVTPAVIPTGLSDVLVTTLDEIALRAETRIREHLEQHSQGLGLEWVGQGHKAQIGTRCPHCGQEMEGLEIFKAYRAFFSGELQEQQATQQRIIDDVEQGFAATAQQVLQQLLNAHTVERDWWRDAGGYTFQLPVCPTSENIIAAIKAVRAAIVSAIERKQAQPSVRVSLTEAEQAAVAAWTQMSEALTAYSNALAPINANIAERQRTAGTVDIATIERCVLHLNAQKKRHEANVVEAYSKYDAAVASKATNERAKSAANEALRQQSEKILKEYGDRINVLLEAFQTDFRIVSAGVTFRGGPPSGDLAFEILGSQVSTTPEDARNPSRPSLANTLSSGDRSALGLAFFLAVVERDAELGTTVVVFDDPVHSQDRSRRRRTVECIHRIANRSRQCFVLSHDLDFAREAARVIDVPVRTFKIDPMADHSLLDADDLPSLPSRAYEQDYAKLRGYMRNSAAYATQLKDVARCLRPALEGYLHTKFPDTWAEKDWLGDMIEKIRGAQPGELLYLAAHLVTELTQLNEYSKRFYHREEDGSEAANIDPRELLGYVEQTLRVISR